MAVSEANVLRWTLGDRMRKAREARNIRPGEMAEIMMRDRNTITNYERGKTRPPRNVVDRWAEVTGVPVEWIVGDAHPFDWRTPPPPRSRGPNPAPLLGGNRNDPTAGGSVTQRYHAAAA